MANKQNVLDLISDTVTDLLYYDRKEDSSVPLGEIERMIEEGEITVDEIVEAFKRELTEGSGQ